MKLRKIFSSAVLFSILLASGIAFSQSASTIFVQPNGGTPVAAPVDGSNYIYVNCAVGCGGGGGGGAVTQSGTWSMTPLGATTTNASGSVTVTNTFQAVFASSGTRKGCTVQNNGSNVMYVFFGAIGSATSSNSFQLSPGQGLSCAVGGVAVATDAVNITGTSGETFTATRQ